MKLFLYITVSEWSRFWYLSFGDKLLLVTSYVAKYIYKYQLKIVSNMSNLAVKKNKQTKSMYLNAVFISLLKQTNIINYKIQLFMTLLDISLPSHKSNLYYNLLYLAMTQVYDMCTFVGELAFITIGNVDPINEPPKRSQELRQIIQWTKQIKVELETEKQNNLQLNSEINRLRSMPLRQELLTSIDLGVQEQMRQLNVQQQLGNQLLKRIMQIVEVNIMILLKQIDDLRNHQSKLLQQIENLHLKISQNISNRVVNQEVTSPDVQGSPSKNMGIYSVQHLKQQKDALNLRLTSVTEELMNANRRLKEIQLQQSMLQKQQNLGTKQDLANSVRQQMLQKISLLANENQNIKQQLISCQQNRQQYELKVQEMTNTIQNITFKNNQLQNKVQKLNQVRHQYLNQKSDALSKELLISNKKIEQMMNRVASYQNKVIDLELQKEALTFQLNTYKQKIEEIRKARTNKISESGRLIQSSRINESSRIQQSLLSKPQIKQIQEKEQVMILGSPTNKRGKQRIFAENYKIKRQSSKSSQINDQQGNKPSKTIY